MGRPTLAEIEAATKRLQDDGVIRMPTQQLASPPAGTLQMPTQEMASPAPVVMPTQELASPPAGTIQVPTQELTTPVQVPTQEIASGGKAYAQPSDRDLGPAVRLPEPAAVPWWSSGTSHRGIAPPQPDATVRDANGQAVMEPVLNNAGQQIGERPKTDPQYFQNPFGGGGGRPMLEMQRGPDMGGPDLVPGGVPAMAPAAAATPQAAPAQFVGARFDDSRIPYRRGTQEALLQTFDRAAQAEDQVAKAEQQKSAVVADKLAAEADRMEQQRAVNMARELQRQQLMKRQADKLEQVTNDAAKSPTSVGQFLEGRSTGGKIAAYIGIALGGALQAKGRENPALTMINDEIRRGIDQQKANVDNQTNLLSHYRQMFGDEQQADLAAEMTARQAVMKQIDAAAARADSPIIAANAQRAIEALKAQQVETRAKFDQLSYVAAHMVGGGHGTIKTDANVVRLPDGRSVRFPTEKEAIEARAKLTAAYNVVGTYDKALRLRKELSAGHPVDSYKKLEQLDSMAENILPEWSLANGQGQVKEEEAKRYKKNLFPFSSVWDPAADDIIRQQRDVATTQIDNLVRGSGGEYVTEGYTPGPDGNLRKDVELQGVPAKAKPIGQPKGFKPAGGER